MYEGVVLNMSSGGRHGPIMHCRCAGSRQWSLISLGIATSMGVDTVISMDDLWMSTTSLAFKVGVRFIICLSLEYLLIPNSCFQCWNHCSPVCSNIVVGSSVEYHFQGRTQLSCSIQSPKGCSRNLCASEKRSRKSCHVSHHNLGGLCWFDQISWIRLGHAFHHTLIG
jgi:hypothetical protein